jgi:hypothetical protein
MALTPAQEIIYSGMNDYRDFKATMARGSGKTFLIQQFVIDNYKDNKIAVATPTKHQFNMSYSWLLDDLGVDIKFSSGKFYDVVLVDEACHITKQLAEEVEAHSENYIMLSSGTWADNHFAKRCMTDLECFMSLPYWMMPKNYYGKDILQRIIAMSQIDFYAFMMDYCAAFVDRVE